MVKIQKIGQRRVITNPANGQQTVEIPVTFIENGRSGLNEQLAQSGAALSDVFGTKIGLEQFRVHTFPVPEDQFAPIKEAYDKKAELPLFINRKLTSLPQMRQQENVVARIIDNKLTYVSTYLSKAPEDDKDLRSSLDVMAQINPGAIANAITGTAVVQVLEEKSQRSLEEAA